jgi:hypothetical protein
MERERVDGTSGQDLDFGSGHDDSRARGARGLAGEQLGAYQRAVKRAPMVEAHGSAIVSGEPHRAPVAAAMGDVRSASVDRWPPALIVPVNPGRIGFDGR